MPTILRPILRAWFAFRLLRLRRRLRATDAVAQPSGDPRADRVLVVGTGLTRGWGFSSHRDALPGLLARAVASATGRGCDVDVIGAEAMNVRSALSWIGARHLEEVDALVLALGLNDALRQTAVDDWERGMRDLLFAVVGRLRPEAGVVLLGIPPLRAIPEFDGLAARLATAHRRRLDDATARVALELGVTFVRLPDVDGARETPAVFMDRVARLAAAPTATQLLAGRPEADVRDPLAAPEWAWSGSEELVALAATGGAPKLRRLAEAAQKRFKVELAVVSLVNGDRLYYANNTDVMPESVPLELSFCQATIDSGAAVVVPDARRDERFADNPMLELSFINFYAGYPLHSSDGQVIGSFCLQGSRPRAEGAVSLEALRGMALEAEAELRRFEKPADGLSDPERELVAR